MICKLALISLTQTPAGVKACATVQVLCPRYFSGLSQATTAPTEVCAAVLSLLTPCKAAQFSFHTLHSLSCSPDFRFTRLCPCPYLLYIFKLSLWATVSYLYPHFLLGALSLTVVNHPGCPPSCPTPAPWHASLVELVFLGYSSPPSPASGRASCLLSAIFPHSARGQQSPCILAAQVLSRCDPSPLPCPHRSPFPTRHPMPVTPGWPGPLQLPVWATQEPRGSAAPAMLPASSLSQTVLPKLQPHSSGQILKWFILPAASEDEAYRDIKGKVEGRMRHTHRNTCRSELKDLMEFSWGIHPSPSVELDPLFWCYSQRLVPVSGQHWHKSA